MNVAPKLHTKLAILGAVVLLLGLFLYGAFAWSQTKRDVQQSLHASLDQLQHHFNEDLLQKERSLKYVAALVEQQSRSHAPGSIALAESSLRALEPMAGKPAIFLPSGEALVTGAEPDLPLPAAFGSTTVLGRMQLSRPYTAGPEAGWRVALRVPLVSATGALDGYLVTSLPLDYFGASWNAHAPTLPLRLGWLRDDGYVQGMWPAPSAVEAPKLYGASRTGVFRQYLLDHNFPESGSVEGFNNVVGDSTLYVFRRQAEFALTLTLILPSRAQYGLWAARMAPAFALVLFLLGCLGWIAFRMRQQALREWAEKAALDEVAHTQSQRTEFLLENLSFGVVLHAASGAVLYCNPDAQRLLGLSREQFEGKAPLSPDWKLLREDGSELPEDEYPVAEVLRTRQRFHSPMVGLRTDRDAALRWLMGDATPVFSASGNLEQVIVTFMDVTAQRNAQDQYHETQKLYRGLVDNSFYAVLQFAPSGAVVFANPAACQMFGMDARDLARKHLSQLVFVHDGRFDLLIKQRHGANHCRGEVAMLRDSGAMFDAEVSMNFQQAAEGPWLSSLVASDITERQKVWRALQSSETRMKGIVDSAMDAIICIDSEQKILVFNPSAQRMFGYTAEEMLGQSLDRLLPEAVREAHRGHVRRFAETGHSNRQMGPLTQLTAKRRGGSLFPIEASISQVFTQENRLMTVILRDISSRLEAQQALDAAARDIARVNAQLEHIAHFDMLTGLPNRVLLADRLRQALFHCQRSGYSLAVAFLDLDGFKEVNDSHGHEVGDKLLVVLSQRMKIALREEDTLARIGGDEFVAVLTELSSPQDCEPILDRLLYAASEPLVLDDITVRMSCSIGVTIYPKDGAEAEMLLRHADQAMYRAKQSGKGRYEYFDVAEDAQIQSRINEVEAVRAGFERDEFTLYYQPKVHLISGKVVGCEALVRWQHPQKGLIPPGLFLPLIEDDPVSIALGEWVIEHALIQMQRWQQEGLNIPVSVNIGAQQLQADGFAGFVAQAIQRYPSVPASWLELEVLETSALEDIGKVSQVMQQLRELGIRFALDDFGTGYSSLTYLKLLPAELLKVDQSFVRDMLVDSDDRAIVQGVVSLAKAFAREVIAEGVETAAHGAHLLGMGCHLAQGYGIARPMPPEQLPAWIAQWGTDPAWNFGRVFADKTSDPAPAFSSTR